MFCQVEKGLQSYLDYPQSRDSTSTALGGVRPYFSCKRRGVKYILTVMFVSVHKPVMYRTEHIFKNQA